MKKKTWKTAKRLWIMLLAAVLLLSLTGCSPAPTNSNQKLDLDFPAVTAEQAASARQAQQTPMLLTESTWELGVRRYIYDENNQLIRVDTYEGKDLAYYTEYKSVHFGTAFTAMTYYPDGSLYDPEYQVITRNEKGQCVQVTNEKTYTLKPSTDTGSTTYVFEYDAQGRLNLYTDTRGKYEYIYDENGDVKEQTAWNGIVSINEYKTKAHATYERDAAGQPIRAQIKTYDVKTGQLTKTTNAGSAVEYKNDANGKLAELNRYDTSNGWLQQKIVYHYDETGKLIGCTKTRGLDIPERGLEWMVVDKSWWGVEQATWLTPEAYRAQANP